MKKLKYLLLTILLMFPINVLAAGSISPSTRSLTVNKGKTATFRITASNAVGRVDITSSNPSVASVNISNSWLENNSVTVTVSGKSAGVATITVRLSDAATFDEEELSGSYSITVNVKDGTSSPNGNSGGNSGSSSNLSNNTNLKVLKVEGYEIENNNGKYSLTVSNDVSSINILAEAEHSKSKISGAGKKELNIGENKIDITVTSESGSKKVYQIIVTRKDGYYLNEIKEVLAKEKNNEVNLILNENIISKENIEAIKESKKIVKLSSYDENKKEIYSWIVDGNKVTDSVEFNTNLSFTTDKNNEIDELSNYAKGIYLNFEHSGKLPAGTKIRVYVGDTYTNGQKLNVYYFNDETKELETIKKDIEVSNGYIEYDIDHCSDYFVSLTNINDNITNSNFNFYMISSIVELVIIIILGCLLMIKPKKRKI